MKKRILCAILSLAAVFSLVGFKATQAWFNSGENKALELKAGKIAYTATGNVTLKKTDVDILPGTELEFEKAIVITNNSSIDTELRIKVNCTYDGEEDAEWDNSWIEFITEENGGWVQEGEFIYYRPNGNGRIPAVKTTTTVATTASTTEATETTTDEAEVVSEEESSEITEETTTETTTVVTDTGNKIPFAGKIRISKNVDPDFNNEKVNFSFVIQAKQADFMEWQDFEPVTEPDTEATTA